MSRAAPVSLLALLLLLGTILNGAEAKFANGARRVGHRLASDESPPLEQHQVNSVQHCLALCDGLAGCVALNFGTVTSDTANCQLLGQRACDGLPLVTDAAVDYYDVYDEPQNRTAETQTPFWNDPSCVQGGYCAADCAAEAAGEFCIVDKHCSTKLKPPGGYQCVDGTCQLSDDLWELRTGLALPRWQLWRMDWSTWTWKRLKPDTCTLDVSVKLGVGAMAHIMPAWTDKHVETRIVFRFSTMETDIIFFNSENEKYFLAQNANTNGMVSTDAYSRLKVSWCGGNLAIGPEDNPTLVTAQASITQSINYVTVYSPPTDSWMHVDSGVADRWLYDDTGIAPDAVMDIGLDTYAFRNISATNDVTVRYDCMAEMNCNVKLRGDEPRTLLVCIGCGGKEESEIVYEGDINMVTLKFNTGPVLSATEFNTFSVRYNSGIVTVYRNDASTPMYDVNVPYRVTNINLIGIGGGEVRKYVRAARYDPAWRTDTWLTEGRGYSNGDEPELEKTEEQPDVTVEGPGEDVMPPM